MKILVTYQSKTGFTKKYAEWISSALDADLQEVSKIHKEDINKYDLIIHGGWIMGGTISGLEKLREMSPQKIVVFGVGFTAKEEVDIPKYREENKLGDTPFFYYEGGLNPKKMGFMGRMIVKAVMKKTPEYCDHTDQNEVSELINTVKAMRTGEI